MPTSDEPSIEIHIVEDDSFFNLLFDIRTKVFVDELQVWQEEEFDGFDHLSTHFIAFYNKEPAGTARLRRMSVSGKMKLERFAVLPDFRNKGIGSALVKYLLDYAGNKSERFVHVPIASLSYFEKLGFAPEGEVFDEAGLPSKKMVYHEGLNKV